MRRRSTPVLVILAALLLVPVITAQAASTPYIVSVIDRDAWVQSDSVISIASASVGSTATFCIWVDPASGADDFDGGFDFLIRYDDYVMAFQSAVRGPDLAAEWEYFSYRSGAGDSCAGCPSGLVRIVGVCDINDAVTPPESARNLAGCIAELSFGVGPDNSQQGLCHQVDFYSIDCTDNVISSRMGDSLYLPLSGTVHHPPFDSTGCHGTGHPYIHYTSGQLCINGGTNPPDTLPSPYHVGIIDRNAWVLTDSVIPVTHVDGGSDWTTCLWVDPGSSAGSAEGGFDFLVTFDAAALTLSSVVQGNGLAPEWEYFSYQVLPAGSCSGCPDGLVRVTGVCNLNDGITPPDAAFDLSGCVAELTFTASADPAAAGCHGINFFSNDCGDNVISSRLGDSLFLPAAGDIHGPLYDSTGCATGGYPLIHYAGAQLCINGGNQPPDTLNTPYDVRIVNRNGWLIGDTALSYTMAPGGADATVCLWVDPASGGTRSEGGFDFLVLYNSDVLTVLNVNRGADLAPGWEYFTWRSNVAADSCLGPSEALVRIVGIANLLDNVTPPDEAYQLSGCIAEIVFHVFDNPNHLTSCSSIGFYGMDCGDNAITTRTGDSLFIPMGGVLYCDGFDPASCISDTLVSATPAIHFTPGEICIFPPVTWGGDLNLNGIPYEIADAVLYSHFFLYGQAVFDPVWGAEQIHESETNCDSLFLTLADFAYLWNVVIGDLQICNPNGEVSPAGPGPALSGEDTIRVMSVNAQPGDVISVDFYLRNVDTLHSFDFRLRYDPAALEPLIHGGPDSTSLPTLDAPVQLRGNSFEMFGGGIPQPGVVTFIAADMDPYTGGPFLPGAGPTVHTQWRVLPGVASQVSLLAFESDPAFPNSYNTMVDIRAENWKRPVMIGGTVNIGSAPCDCSGRCDFDADGFLTTMDMGLLIDVLFAGQPDQNHPNCPTACGDYDGDLQTTSLDLSGLIDHLFAGRPGPSDPCK